MALITATGPIPVEPPVGTTLTAPGSRHAWTHTDDGWWVTDRDGNRLAAAAPAGEWRRVAAALVALGGILTVTTEYQVQYRYATVTNPDAPIRTQSGFSSRESAQDWADADVEGIVTIGIRSQQVTRSAWTDETLDPLEPR